MGADAASAFLIGRLAQQGRRPHAVLKASPGSWRFTGVHVFAVDGERLWLAQPRLLGEPSIASVPLGEVGEITVRTGRSSQDVRLDVPLARGSLRLRVLDDAEACDRFVEAVREGRGRQ
jgi:hypothetical protein